MAKKKKLETIPEPEIIEYSPEYLSVQSFLEKMKGKGSASQPLVKEMFSLYETITKRKETGYTCSSCVARVFNFLKAWYAKKTEEYLNG